MFTPGESIVPVVLAGCGEVARTWYLPALRALQTAGLLRVTALVDPSPLARSQLAATFSSAQQVGTLDEVAAPKGSLVIIASPSDLHPAHAVSAFDRGWHVLCEAPLAPSAAEARTMIAAAEARHAVFAVSLYKRFFPTARYLHELCRDQALGPLVGFFIHESGPGRESTAVRSPFDAHQTPTGVWFELGVHTLDLVTWWLGTPPAVDYSDDAMGGVEANAHAILRLDDGARGVVQFSRDWSAPGVCSFEFERGRAEWKIDEAGHLSVQLSGTRAALQADLVAADAGVLRSEANSSSVGRSFLAQLRNVLGAIAGEEPLLIPAAQALVSMDLIESCYARRRLLDQPWLSPEEQARAGQLERERIAISP